MAITITPRDSGHVVVSGISSTASVSPAAGSCLILTTSQNAGTVAAGVPSGCNLTWKRVDSKSSSNNSYTMAIYVGYGPSPTTDQVTFPTTAGIVTWSLLEATGVQAGDPTNTNHSVVENTGSTTIGTTTLAGLQTGSAVYAASLTGFGTTNAWTSPMVQTTAVIFNASFWFGDAAAIPGTTTPAVTWSATATPFFILTGAIELLAAAPPVTKSGIIMMLQDESYIR